MNTIPIPPIPGLEQSFPIWSPEEIQYTVPLHPEEVAAFPDGFRAIRNVSWPTLTPFLPDPASANGTAVVVCPGGAYHFLAWQHEGVRVAQWLNTQGIAAFVLKYRLVQTGNDFPACVDANLNDPEKMKTLVEPVFPLVAADGCQAIRLLRNRATEWRIDPQRIGILGFSAGGMLSLMVAHQFDPSSRPAFAAPIYSAPPPEAPIPADAPPLFLLCAADDDMASGVSTETYARWRAAGHRVELHIYAQGGHGFGMHRKNLPSDDWMVRFVEWLRAEGFLSQPV